VQSAGGRRVLVRRLDLGCGSSREHAVWCLRELVLRCINRTTYGGGFAGNCAPSGVPAISTAADEVDRLMALASDNGLEAVGTPADISASAAAGKRFRPKLRLTCSQQKRHSC
jgi:3-isopropylmalate dehydratase small subunit